MSDRPEGTDAGTAVVEFLVLGVLLLVPLLYLALAVSAVQRAVYGVTQAAREAGRAYATGSAAAAPARARYAAELALLDQGLPADGLEVRYGPADGDCAAAGPEPWPLEPGAVFAVCVTRGLDLPAVPGALAGRRTTVTGRYVVRADPHRDYSPGATATAGIPGTAGTAGTADLVGAAGIADIPRTPGMAGIAGNSGAAGMAGIAGSPGAPGIVGTAATADTAGADAGADAGAGVGGREGER